MTTAECLTEDPYAEKWVYDNKIVLYCSTLRMLCAICRALFVVSCDRQTELQLYNLLRSSRFSWKSSQDTTLFRIITSAHDHDMVLRSRNRIVTLRPSSV